MAITTPLWNRKNKRSKGESLLIVCLFAASSICGCKVSYEQSGTDAPAPIVASSQTETQIKQSAQEFITQLHSGDFARATSFLTPDLQKKMTTAQLQEAARSGILNPLASGENLRYEPVQTNGKGNRATLRFTFDTPKQKDYHMNFVYEKSGSDWKINTLVPPAKRGKPTVTQGQTSASSQ